MKPLLIGVVYLCLTHWVSYAQTEALNQQKYWKLRNNFKEQFIKIGSQAGENAVRLQFHTVILFY
jgi:hypothetical protein